MSKKPSHFFRDRINSFGYAFKGIFTLFKEETHAQIHLLAVIVVCGAGIYFQLSANEWALICLAIGLVIVSEAINTAIERIMDFISKERQPEIGKIKDIAAGAVLLAAFTAIAIAAFVFIPKLTGN